MENYQKIKIKTYKTKQKATFKGVPKQLPQKAFSALFVGSRGVGKSTIMRNLIEIYGNNFPKMNRFMISPTARLDDTMAPLFDDDNIYLHYSDSTIDHIINLIELEIENAKMEIFERVVKRFLKRKKYVDREREGYGSMEIDPDDIPELQKLYKKALDKQYKPESYLLVVDDALGMFPDRSKLTYLFTRHRHYNLSLMVSTQSFRSTPVVIRNNSILNFLFMTNHKEAQKLEEEFSNYRSPGGFKRMFQEVAEGYNFLLVDRTKPKKKQYFQNLDTPIDMAKYEGL